MKISAEDNFKVITILKDTVHKETVNYLEKYKEYKDVSNNGEHICNAFFALENLPTKMKGSRLNTDLTKMVELLNENEASYVRFIV